MTAGRERSAPVKRVEVRWLDTVALNHGWQSPRTYRRRARGAMRKMRTCGYLMRKTRSLVLVANSRMAGNGNVDYVMSIPRSQVIRIRRLR
jgi:hypothetical protein